MLVNLNQKICEKKLFMYKELIKRRSKNEPVAYIIRRKRVLE
jgi:methylase of polypeptide subunit release factors